MDLIFWMNKVFGHLVSPILIFILGTEEQDELVERLRNETVVSNKRYIFTLRVILSLASVL